MKLCWSRKEDRHVLFKCLLALSILNIRHMIHRLPFVLLSQALQILEGGLIPGSGVCQHYL